MTQVDFKSDFMGLSTTECPFKEEDTFGVKMVGSMACYQCMFHQSTNKEGCVECNHSEEPKTNKK